MRDRIKQLVKDVCEARKNTLRSMRVSVWKKYVGFRFTWYERHTVNKPPAVCGFQLDVGIASIYYGV